MMRLNVATASVLTALLAFTISPEPTQAQSMPIEACVQLGQLFTESGAETQKFAVSILDVSNGLALLMTSQVNSNDNTAKKASEHLQEALSHLLVSGKAMAKASLLIGQLCQPVVKG